MATMLFDLPYMEVDITEHVQSVNFLYVKLLKSVKIASFVPKLANGKRPVCLGQNEGKVKKLAVVFANTPSHGSQSIPSMMQYIEIILVSTFTQQNIQHITNLRSFVSFSFIAGLYFKFARHILTFICTSRM